MQTLSEIRKKYRQKIDLFDLEILIAHELGKSREFILTHPDYEIPTLQIKNLKFKISRRVKGEPIAYIIGHKEFYGLDFIVNANTLVPRPETEMLVDSIINNQKSINNQDVRIIDVGTGSGNIIISIAKNVENFKFQISNFKFYGIDISAEALKVAKKNAKLHGVEKKIKFLHGNLLSSFFAELNKLKAKKLMPEKLILVANLPYLSKEIYQSAPVDVKKYEPKTALFSSENGLAHYRELLEQINQNFAPCSMLHVSCFLEISPEQKLPLTKLVKTIFSAAKIEFKKDLAGKWRVCAIEISPN
jgi:release factor glutamine methyltransferase